MFSKGDKVVYKSNAVCSVESVETPSFIKDKTVKYYKLRQLFSTGNDVVYVPVESDVHIRSVLSKDEAKDCFDYIRNVETEVFSSRQPAMISAHFQEQLSDCTIESSLKVLKEILLREKEYSAAGKKLRQVEEIHLKNLEKAISEELSVALGIEIDEVKKKLRECI